MVSFPGNVLHTTHERRPAVAGLRYSGVVGLIVVWQYGCIKMFTTMSKTSNEETHGLWTSIHDLGIRLAKSGP